MVRRQLTVGSEPSAVGSWQLAINSLQTAHCKLPTVYCLLLTANCLLISACFQPETACLDIEATNFDIAADEDCGDDDSVNGCPCTYPDFSFGSINYLVDKSTYSDDGIYLVDSQYIQIANIQFYLSDFRVRRITGEWISVEDTIGLTVLTANGLKDTILTDDFILLNNQRSIELGSIKQSGAFDSLRFVVGINELANTVDPDSVSVSNHPLAESEMHLGNTNDGYIFNQLVIQRDTMMDTSPITLNISGNGQLVTIQKLISAKSTIGRDFSLGTLTINHAKWFDGIKFVTDTDAVMIEKIVANTPNVFSITN